jgi:hypothetical protein
MPTADEEAAVPLCYPPFVRERRFLFVSAVVLVAIGCGPDTPEFNPLPVDGGRECGAAGDGGEAASCGDGQICLAGRCYDGCESDQQCSGAETCEDGVCTTGTGPRPDAGVDMGTDAGPCTGVMCEDPEVCHPNSGVCVQCIEGGSCGAAAPICDFAYGSCVAFRSGILCAPCNIDADCPNAGETCVDRGTEQVCLAACDAENPCPGGLRCDGGVGHCVPNLGTCTQLRNAIDRTACTADIDCVPLGSAAAPGTCDPTAMECLAACSEGFSCPGGFACDDPTEGFCRAL